jgi:hypothetical protein
MCRLRVRATAQRSTAFALCRRAVPFVAPFGFRFAAASLPEPEPFCPPLRVVQPLGRPGLLTVLDALSSVNSSPSRLAYARLQRRRLRRLLGAPRASRGHPFPVECWTPSTCAHVAASRRPELAYPPSECRWKGVPARCSGRGASPPQNRPERLGAPGLAATVAAAPYAVFVLDFGSPPIRPSKWAGRPFCLNRRSGRPPIF